MGNDGVCRMLFEHEFQRQHGRVPVDFDRWPATSISAGQYKNKAVQNAYEGWCCCWNRAIAYSWKDDEGVLHVTDYPPHSTIPSTALCTKAEYEAQRKLLPAVVIFKVPRGRRRDY